MNQNDFAPAKRLLAVAAGLVAAILLCIAFVDRPASLWAFDHFHRLRVVSAPTHVVDPILPAAVLGIAILGVGLLGRLRLPSWTRVPLECCLAAVIAYSLKEHLKYAFGRTWPETFTFHNPSWIGTGVFRFQPFHGGAGWASFPSGHTTMITAPCAVLWERAPRLRLLWFLISLAVALSLFLADYHFVSDILAGAGLGTACGLSVVAASSRSF
jgi:membrane-associated phospholipid phosphatase